MPNERLVTDWLDWRGNDTRPPTRLAWLLDDVPGGTRVTLGHDGFSRVVDQGDYPFGWVYFVEKLKATVETTAAWAPTTPKVTKWGTKVTKADGAAGG